MLSSSYAVVAGVPLAAIGAAAYFSVFSLTTLAAFGYELCEDSVDIACRGDVFRESLARLFAGIRDSRVLPVLFVVGSRNDRIARGCDSCSTTVRYVKWLNPR